MFFQKEKSIDKQESIVSKAKNVDMDAKTTVDNEIKEGETDLDNVYNKSNALKGNGKL